MVWLAILFGLLFLLVLYLLFAPLYIEINTLSGLYQIRYHRFLRFRFMYAEGKWVPEFKIMWWHISLKNEKRRKADKKQAKKSKNSVSWRALMAVIGTFEFRKFHVSIDTGDPALNGICYPGVWWIARWWGKDISINFEGKNVLDIQLRNSLGRMLWAYIRTKK